MLSQQEKTPWANDLPGEVGSDGKLSGFVIL
jgi:hypothetical protein